eukprot:6208763-Pleurochrysis_carterae.AAC.3
MKAETGGLRAMQTYISFIRCCRWQRGVPSTGVRMVASPSTSCKAKLIQGPSTDRKAVRKLKAAIDAGKHAKVRGTPVAISQGCESDQNRHFV